MNDFVCIKCGSTEYEIRDKPNGTGVAHGLYCAKCGFWHKWLNKRELSKYTNCYDKDIARLEAENAELKARLEKAVELPYKIGDTIYHLSNLELQELKVISFEITEKFGILCCTRDKNGDLHILGRGLFDTWVFIDKAEAEVKLSELKGTTNN